MIKQRVLDILKEKGLKQTYLIDKLGITRQALHIQLNSDAIQLNSLTKIATALDVPIEQLFTTTQKTYTNTCKCPHCGKPIEVYLK